MAQSDTILGRVFNREAFAYQKPFKVSVYTPYAKVGTYRYSDPVTSDPGPRVLYRIIIRPRRIALDYPAPIL